MCGPSGLRVRSVMKSRRKVTPFTPGAVVGRLTIVSCLGRVERQGPKRKYKKLMYECECLCGNRSVTEHHQMVKGEVKSCGCLKRELNSELAKERNTTHGLSKDVRYTMWHNAKRRALESGKEFDLDIEDIVIPTHCPVLGIELIGGVKKPIDTSPSLDRIDSSRGYTKDNVCVVSFRLNRMKNCFSIQEMEATLDYMKNGRETYQVKT